MYLMSVFEHVRTCRNIHEARELSVRCGRVTMDVGLVGPRWHTYWLGGVKRSEMI